ncbi:hypothetical protein KR215_010481 [Drosophila sulfurigaster]|nr:hypothetical protein KR215_010481 [Drosophila sulfurigaster]
MKNVIRAFVILSVFIAETFGRIEKCDYLDTVDLTYSRKFENGSYLYEDILIPKEETGEYNYQILFNGKTEIIPNHIRGCICHLKTCIRFCCNPNQTLVQDKRECGNVDQNLDYNSFLNITYNETQIKHVDVLKLMVQQHLPVPCDDHLALNPDNPNHEWTLYENGILLRHFDGAQLSKADYCLQPQKFQNTYRLVPHHCLIPPNLTNAYTVFKIPFFPVQSVSIFFYIMVIFVYLLLPCFKGVYRQCCLCYFGCLTLTFILIVIIRIDWIKPHQILLCKLTGYIGYYITISTFLWLLIINYDLWKTFNNIGISHGSKFYKYNIFVWGVAAVQLLLTLFVDFVIGNSNWSPNVGEYFCWIDTAAWSSIIYYYGPISIYLTFNTTLFIITASKIFFQNRTNRRQLTQSDHQRNLRTLTNFGTFFRLFVIMGVFWILEIISYFGQMFDISMQFIDVICCGQGIILFVATILKRDVLKALANR